MYTYPVPAITRVHYPIAGMSREWVVEISPFGYRRMEKYQEIYTNKINEICDNYKIWAMARENDPQKKAKSTSNEAVFYNKERKVVLRGNPQLIRTGGDIVKGKEITYELDTGWVRVEHVEGVLQPKSEPGPIKTPQKKKK